LAVRCPGPTPAFGGMILFSAARLWWDVVLHGGDIILYSMGPYR
jgi:hypothetical protein